MDAPNHAETTSTDWSRWYIVPESGKSCIKRYRTVGGVKKWQRYPAKLYRGLSGDPLTFLLNRLNASYESDRMAAEARYAFDHAYVNVGAIERFQKHVQRNSRLTEHGPAVVTLLNQYVFEFFILKESLADPSRWHRREAEYGEWLLEQGLSAGTIKRIVSTANRFTKFLIEKVYPNMDTPRKLEPIGRVVLSDLGTEKPSKYITPKVFELMVAHVKQTRPEVYPHLMLCYHFGLRISETQGLTKAKFRRDDILIDEQGDHIENGEVIRKTVKTDARNVPYWNMTAKEAWALVQLCEPMHPDTLKRRLNDCLAKFGHTSHDCRRTFITNALRRYHWQDVQKAVGHTDVRTTMSYNQDDRNFSNEPAELD